MAAPIRYPGYYEELDSPNIMLEAATEYIPRHFRRERPDNLVWVGAFLYLIGEGLTIRQACARAGVAYSSVFAERDRNPDFKAAWEEAVRSGTDALEDHAIDRAKDKSDLLMMFLLKSRDPGRFNDKSQLRAGTSVNIQINHRYPAKDVSPSIEVKHRTATPDSEQITAEQADTAELSACNHKVSDDSEV